MKFRLKLGTIVFLLACFASKTFAQTPDSIQISLLTVKPRSNEVYTIYGHTAIRIKIPSRMIDTVLNYGTFDFDSPNFLYRYLKGKADYSLSDNDFQSFFFHYSRANSTIIEQKLNLPEADKEKIVRKLAENLLPENVMYQYNYFFDNCTTRPRNIIEQASSQPIVYTGEFKKTSFRDLVHDCTRAYPWMGFGIDLLIGSGADSVINRRSAQFLPVELMNSFDQAYLVNNGSMTPLVLSKSVLMETQTFPESKSFALSPAAAGFILFFVCLIFAVGGFIWKKRFRFFFSLIFLIAGLAGCLVAFIAFVSVHPCTWPNWNLVWLHPLYLIAVVGYCFKKTSSFILWYHGTNFVLLSILLICWKLIPQELNTACIPFILSLAVCSGFTLAYDKKIKK